MFAYDKKLQYPVRIQNPNPALAKIILTQYGGQPKVSFPALLHAL